MKKIVIIGPESTGKSSLCGQLASRYNTIGVQEYAREYLLAHGTGYSFNDLLVIAKGQIGIEEQGITSLTNRLQTASGTKPLLFIDTNMYVMKVWCEVVFNNCHQYILDQIALRKYDLYLLCDTDLPWVKDELREYPDLIVRRKLFHIYHNLLINQPVPWALISGSYEERLKKAIDAVEVNLRG